MAKKSKTREKPRVERFFQVQRVFPPSDKLGLDMLRLMAAYNDIGRVIDWLRAEPANQKNERARKISSARRSMLLRLLVSFLHEAYKVIDEMENLDTFPRLETLLDKQGREALSKIRQQKAKADQTIPELMRRARDKATFHYLRPYFADAIKEFKAKRGEDIQSSFIFERTSGGIRSYYLLADHLRDAIAFGVVSPQQAEAMMREMAKVQGYIVRFLDRAMLAYGKDRGLQGAFKDRPDETE